MILTNLQRAALLSAALFIFTSVNSFSAETKSKKAETSKDIIEKAYNLSLQKDRAQAINILVNAIRQEKSRNGTGSVPELTKSLHQVSYLFYTDRTQQTYELALSLRKTDLSQSAQKMNEALRAEPDNMTLFLEAQRLSVIKGDCSAALESLSKERIQNPFDENLNLVQAQALTCLKRWDAYKKLRDEDPDLKKSTMYKYWLPLEIELALYEKNLMKAKEFLSALVKLDSRYPEISYWQWRIAPDHEKAAHANRYMKDCKNISSTVYRQYMTDVDLCRKVSEIEMSNKNSNGNHE